MKIDVLNTKGEKVEQISLSDDVFNIKPHKEAILQYLRVFSFNQRQGTSKTKTRGEVSGGGKKPWKQKGTGRARVGSSRNPIWRHGGVAHGPTPKDWGLNLNKKVRQLAMKSALSQKFIDKKVCVLDKFNFKEPKTKQMIDVLNNLKLGGKKVLLVLIDNDTNIIKSASNMSNIDTSLSSNVNVHEILNFDHIVFVKDSIKNLEERFMDKGKKDEEVKEAEEKEVKKDTKDEIK